MAKSVLFVIIATAILLTGTIMTSFNFEQYAEALKGQGVSSSQYGSATKLLVCGDVLCSEYPGGYDAFSGNLEETVQKHDSSYSKVTPSTTAKHHMMAEPPMLTTSGTITSETDPGMGHELHHLAVILAPSDKVYKGILTYSASENIQLVALHGPLAEGQDKGQTIWTPDGNTKFALTLVDPENKMGSWVFTGNALALHTFKDTPFTASYSVHYAKVGDSFGMMGTCYCAADCTCDKDGVCTCPGNMDSTCMCGPNCTCGEDGTCQCGMHGSDGTCQCGMHGSDGTCQCGMHGSDGTCQCGMHGSDGTCQCGMHGSDGTCQCGMHGSDGTCQCGMHGSDGTCQCGMHGSDGTCQCGMHGEHGSTGHKMKAVSGTMTSDTDPGMGHELHQLAVLLPPKDQAYSGVITYSASENIQLVALHGPLAEGQDKGQTIWTPDGNTKFALTLVDPENKMGSWVFTGNALALHTFKDTPFTASYSIVTMDGGMHDSVMSKRAHGETCDCASDCTCDKDGVCTCSGEEGPCMCGPNCNCGQ